MTGLPIPLAAICARTDIDAALTAAAERAIRASVEFAFANPESGREWIRAHAQELSDAVCDQHIALYVNAFSVDLGPEGLRAIDSLVGTGAPR